jgi:hypothetical protein
MWKRWLMTLSLAAVPVFGQLASHTLTISATRQISLQPDEAVFGITVSANATVTLDQIVAALSGLNITAANLTGVNNNSAPPTLQWNFTLAVPLSNLTATVSYLTKLQPTVPPINSGLGLTFSVNGTQVSPKLQQSQSCSTSDLIADATAQGQKLAAAAGLLLGPIVRLSNAPSMQPTGDAEYNLGTFRIGGLVDFLVAAAPPISCSLTIQFQLLPQ